MRHKALRVVTVVSATTNLCIAMTTLVLFAGLTNVDFGVFLVALACGGAAGGLLADHRNAVTATVVLIPLAWLGLRRRRTIC